jgi:methionyl-tRNA formyltransferase
VRIIFAGTPEFAKEALQRLHGAGHEIVLVLTQPDRPAGRGMKLQASAVKQFALEHAIPVCQPRSLRLDGKYPEDAAQAQQAIADAAADVMVVAAYGLILPQWVLDEGGKKFGCLNIHGSLLPRWRGAAPIHRAIEAGDAETGITIMQMDAGLDTGDMLMMHSTPIVASDTTATLHDRLADLGGKLIVLALEKAQSRGLKGTPQPVDGVTYAHKIEKHEGAIQWTQGAQEIARKVRAFNPFPGANTTLAGEVVKVWMAHDAVDGAFDTESSLAAECGTIVAVGPAGIAVAAMNSIATLTELQRPGGKRMPAAEFLRGSDIRVGMRFDAPVTLH